MSRDSAARGFFLLCKYLPALALLGIGYFTPHWIENEQHNCTQGLLTNSNCTSNVEDLHSAVVGLESAAIALLTMATIVNVVLECCYGENNPMTTKARCICAFFFGIGGILGLIGCVAVFAEYTHETRGWSFWVSFAGSIVAIVTWTTFKETRDLFKDTGYQTL
ncbi:uncharacterized protein LOC125673053 [Ostrea edulis]|uniref:uncharacterized protein LOC125673053 n=1 Tax=Ostrea edulis TaxID=37623 RepID=UPI0024AF0628|nr:uncharacterized protein LOC125673053 [Ostrea edulis]